MDLKEYFRNRDMIGVQEDELTEEQKNLACITIDGNVIGGYGSYSFVRVVEYVSEPQRSSDGKISNLDGYTTFITPKVKLHFNAISIDGYRLLMNLITSKREFYVGCYDFVSDSWVHQNMYFYPNDYPEIFQYDLQVLAVINFDIELIGTNTNNENIVITLNSNSPEANVESVNYNMSNVYQNEATNIEYPSSFPTKDRNDIAVFDGREYKFGGWNTKADGTGVNYNTTGEYSFPADTTLYAVWYSGKVYINFNWAIGEEELVNTLYKSKNEKFADGEPTVSTIRIENSERVKYEVSDWLTAVGGVSIVGKYPTDLTQSSATVYNAYGTPTRTVLNS